MDENKEFDSTDSESLFMNGDTWSLECINAYNKGYDNGYKDGRKHCEEENMYDSEYIKAEYPVEIVLDAKDFNSIEEIKDIVSYVIGRLYTATAEESIMPLYDIIHRLNLLEESLAGSAILEYYKSFKPLADE